MSEYESVTDDQHIHHHRRIALMISKIIGYVVYFYLVVVEIILFLGFVLLLLGANPTSGFVEWVYRSLERSMQPFRGIFEPINLGTIGSNEVESVFATSIVFAMIVYGILALAISSLVDWLTARVNRLDAEDAEARRLRAYEQGPGAARDGQPSQTTPGQAPLQPGQMPGDPGTPPPPPAY